MSKELESDLALVSPSPKGVGTLFMQTPILKSIKIFESPIVEIVYNDNVKLTLADIIEVSSLLYLVIGKRKVARLFIIGKGVEITDEFRKAIIEENKMKKNSIIAEAIVVSSSAEMISNTITSYDPSQNFKQIPVTILNTHMLLQAKWRVSFRWTWFPDSCQNNYGSILLMVQMIMQKEALAYSWNGVGFDLIPSYRFLFSQTPTSGITKITGNNYTIYPNPTTGKLFINGHVSGHTSIHDMTGKEMISVNNSNEIDVSSMGAGIYIIKTDNLRPVKFIKE